MELADGITAGWWLVPSRRIQRISVGLKLVLVTILQVTKSKTRAVLMNIIVHTEVPSRKVTDLLGNIKGIANTAVERDGLQAALAGTLRASRSGRPSPLR